MKNTPFVFSSLFVMMLISLVVYPAVAPILGITILLLSLAIGIYTIFKKHKESKNPRLKIVKDTFILICTIVLISFLGGVAGLFTNFYVGNMFGAMAGFISAMLAGIVVGYLVRNGITKFIS
jgi:MFS family permease